MRCRLLGMLTVLLLTALAAAPAEAEDPKVYTFQNMYTHPWFFTVMFSSVLGWILGMTKGFSSSRDWLEKYLPSKPLPVVFVLDVFVFVIVGAYVGTGIYDPATLVAALAAGLTWPVGLGALATKVGS